MFPLHILSNIYNKVDFVDQKVKLYVAFPDLKKVLSIHKEIEHILKTRRLNKEYNEYLISRNLAKPCYIINVIISMGNLQVVDGIVDIPKWLRDYTISMYGMSEMLFWSRIKSAVYRVILRTIRYSWPEITVVETKTFRDDGIELHIFGDWSLDVTTAQFASMMCNYAPTSDRGLYAVLKFKGKNVTGHKLRHHKDIKRDLFSGVREIMAELEYLRQTLPPLKVIDGILDIPEWLRNHGIICDVYDAIFHTIKYSWPETTVVKTDNGIELSIFGDWSLNVTTAQFSAPTSDKGLYAILKFEGKNVTDQKLRHHKDIKRDLFSGVREIMEELEYLRKTLPH